MRKSDKKWLYVDDTRIPLDERFDVVQSFQELIRWVKSNGLPELISLDHDLGPDAVRHYHEHTKVTGQINYHDIKERTGMDCAWFLIGHCMQNKIPMPKIDVHSHNPIGVDNIVKLINNYKKSAGEPEDCIISKWPYKNRENPWK